MQVAVSRIEPEREGYTLADHHGEDGPLSSVRISSVDDQLSSWDAGANPQSRFIMRTTAGFRCCGRISLTCAYYSTDAAALASTVSSAAAVLVVCRSMAQSLTVALNWGGVVDAGFRASVMAAAVSLFTVRSASHHLVSRSAFSRAYDLVRSLSCRTRTPRRGSCPFHAAFHRNTLSRMAANQRFQVGLLYLIYAFHRTPTDAGRTVVGHGRPKFVWTLVRSLLDSPGLPLEVMPDASVLVDIDSLNQYARPDRLCVTLVVRCAAGCVLVVLALQ